MLKILKGKTITMLFFLWFGTIHITYSQSKKECDSIINIAIEEIFHKEKFTSAITHLETVRKVAKRNNFTKEYFLATNNLGAAYYQMLDYGNAIKYYLEAYNAAIQNQGPLEEMTILNNIAIVYAKDNNPLKAKEYLEKSYALAKKHKERSRIILYASNLAKLNYEEGNISSSKKYIKEVLQNLENNPAVELNALVTKNRILFSEKEYDRVIENCTRLLKMAQQYDLQDSVSDLQLLLAKTYMEVENWEKATHYITTGITHAVNSDYKLSFFELESLLALKTNNIKQIYSTKDSIVKLNNLINKNKNQEILENSKLRFELTASKHDLEINKEKTTNQRKFYFVSTLSLILILLILGWAFYKKYQLDKQKRELIERNLHIADLELEREKHKINILNQQHKEKELRNELEKEKLKEKQKQLNYKIERKNKQLSDKILFQSTRNELIEEIIDKISNLPQINKNKNTAIAIKNLKSHLKKDTKWEEFTSNFENLNNDFLIKLKKSHPNLNANDIRFLSFIYLNLSYKEIASLLNISPESCRKRKERICKKMGLPSGKLLFEYLSSL